MNTHEKNDKPVKRVLTVDALRHQPGMAAQTGIKAGMKEVIPEDTQGIDYWRPIDWGPEKYEEKWW